MRTAQGSKIAFPSVTEFVIEASFNDEGVQIIVQALIQSGEAGVVT